MAGSLNKALLIGRLGRDPELRYTPSGQPVANFSMATSESWGSGAERQERTEWHNIVIWGKRAEAAHNFLKKGSLIFVEGRIQTRKWQGKDGQDRYTTEVVVQNFEFLEPKDRGAGGGSYDQTPPPNDDDVPPSFNDEDDIPF